MLVVELIEKISKIELQCDLHEILVFLMKKKKIIKIQSFYRWREFFP